MRRGQVLAEEGRRRPESGSSQEAEPVGFLMEWM